MALCLDCPAATGSAKSPRCPECRRERRRQGVLARVRRYQATEKGRASKERYDHSPAAHAAQRRYERSLKGRSRAAEFYARHPGYDKIRHRLEYEYKRRHGIAAPPWEPLPMAYVGDELFAEARRLTGITGDSMKAQDQLGVAVLALLEGRDPREEVHDFNKQEAAYERVQAGYVTNMDGLGLDGAGNVLVEYQEEAS